MFTNRREAGHLLAIKLEEQECGFDLVLGIPRGGVVVADVIASYFNCPLDIVMAKKISSPNWEEYAVGAVAPDGEVLIHKRVEKIINVDRETIEKMAERIKTEIARHLDYFRGNKRPLSLAGKDLLLVDDGIATGFTLKAAIKYLRRQTEGKIIVAVPVSSKNAYLNLREEVDEFIVLAVPEDFYAVGQFYDDFTAVEDREVSAILGGYQG